MAMHRTSILVRLTALALIGVGLSACGGGQTGDILGLEKRTPDEFNVVSRAPLTLPPNYGLRPPDPRGQRYQDLQPSQTAQEALFGRDAMKRLREQKEQMRQQGASMGEIALLDKTGALEADPSIRQVVEEESAALAQEQESFVDDLVFWRSKPEPGDIVDSNEEQRRIQENAALGREVTDGETPSIRRDNEKPMLEWPF
ncbi:DUF3035 domain-containing protein [Marivibrio halodurans]|uniref:DUF3035 domain-containing protein n=1 Tax=Marivibrio halodurans TaxID=2039722 RepID=A0A8J7S8Q6_9PROT|nr:DUF3035 domain-containing protein [Marivibrio halodurans]MBP5858939.1 DUF3035 domain-containing protein [Marivibrio halodurans]